MEPEYKKVVIICDADGLKNAHTLRLSFGDEFRPSRSQLMITMDSIHNKLRFEDSIAMRTNMTISFGGQFLNLIVEPGDSIYIVLPANTRDRDYLRKVVFSGDNSKVNSEITYWEQSFFKRLYNEKIFFDNSINSDEFITKTIPVATRRYMDSVDYYSSGMMPETEDFLKRHIKMYMLYFSVRTDESNPTWTRDVQYDGLRKVLYEDPLFDLWNEANFTTPMYKTALSHYRGFIENTDEEVIANKNSGDNISSTRAFFKAFDRIPSQFHRDYMKFEYLTMHLSRGPELNEIFPEWEDHIKSDFLKERVHEFTDFYKFTDIVYMNKSGETEKIESGTDFDSFLRKRYPGKVIFLDLFATWCGPCIAEFKYTGHIHEKFKGEDIVFVNVCKTSNLPNWEKLIRQVMPQGENYYVEGKTELSLVDKFRISNIPAYFIITKEGNIEKINLRPSNGDKLVELINNFL